MYVGETNNPYQLFSEVLDNSLDEMGEGFGNEIIVEVDTKLNKYTVKDEGRGIPHGMKKLENGQEKEILEVICTKSNSSGKFNTNNYTRSAGINGLGITITSALSENFEISSIRDGEIVTFKSSKGKKTDLIYDKYDKSKHGTITSFIADKEIWKSITIPIEKIKERARVASALGYRVRLFIDGEEIDTNATMFDLIKENDESISIYKDLPIIVVKTENNEEMRVALRYTSDTSDRYFGYTNMLTNSMGGTHLNEISKTIMEAWQDFVDKKRIKFDVELRKTDYLVGLRTVCAVFISQPEFSSQTKEKLVTHKSRFVELMSKFKERFLEILYDNEEITKALLKRFEEYRIAQNKLLARKDIASVIKVNQDAPNSIRRRSVVDKLIECTSKKREGTELILTEGDSAAMPFIKVRNKELQAILPLRGKILNVTFKEPKDAIKSKEICDIANAIGAGIGSLCDPAKTRYERVIIEADADPDGGQIACLVLSVFINMFPDLVKAGMIYVAVPPLYCWGHSAKDYGWTNDVNKIPEGVKYHRFKGLGEMNPDQLEYFLVNPDTRNLIQVEYPSDIEKFNEILGTSAGKNNLLQDLGIIESKED